MWLSGESQLQEAAKARFGISATEAEVPSSGCLCCRLCRRGQARAQEKNMKFESCRFGGSVYTSQSPIPCVACCSLRWLLLHGAAP